MGGGGKVVTIITNILLFPSCMICYLYVYIYLERKKDGSMDGWIDGWDGWVGGCVCACPTCTHGYSDGFCVADGNGGRVRERLQY